MSHFFWNGKGLVHLNTPPPRYCPTCGSRFPEQPKGNVCLVCVGKGKTSPPRFRTVAEALTFYHSRHCVCRESTYKHRQLTGEVCPASKCRIW